KVKDKGFIEYEENDYFFLILEFIKGKSFNEIDSRLFLERAYNERINYFLQALMGIKEFRQNFELHSDLHSGNIMLSEEVKLKVNKIKIIDPGSSRYSYEPNDEDIDLYYVKEELLHIFLSPEEIKKLTEDLDINSLDFPKFMELIENELQQETEKGEDKDTIITCLIAVDNIINFYFNNFDENTNKPLNNIKPERRRSIIRDVQILNTYKENANKIGIVISGDWNAEKHADGEKHEIYITIKNLVIQIIQHGYGKVIRMSIEIGTNLIIERDLIENQLIKMKD
ncbi:unnamed protein product, partial [marine sediment metagenome]